MLFCVGRSVEPGHKTLVARGFLTDSKTGRETGVCVIFTVPDELEIKSFIERIKILVRRGKSGDGSGGALCNDDSTSNGNRSSFGLGIEFNAMEFQIGIVPGKRVPG